ncbi:MAG TPA: hypothetical protein VFX51_19230 [Solirubrobacteraceae bacterium]|nr:hypothetical protein [Solirubrobacteraceae bacterium]
MKGRRLPVAFAACAVLASGCGNDDTNSARTVRAPETPCPPSAPELTVRDVLPEPPAGTTLLRVRQREAEQAQEAFAAGFGDKLRTLHIAVVARKGRSVGTGIGVLNLTVRADDGAPPETSETRQALTIASRDGIIGIPPGGGPTKASGSVGECGIVVINGPDEATVRRVAAAIRQPE